MPSGSGPQGYGALVLVGLMGSGKTTVGRLVAERTGRRFIDTDDVIKDATGRTVRELWEQGGESAYRRLESQVVLDGLRGGSDHTQAVIAAPGGAVLDPEVRAALAEPGVLVVWLHTDPDVIAGRLRPGDHRPLLGDHAADVLRRMEAERASTYTGVADAVIDAGGKDPTTLAEEVVALMATTGDG